MPDFFAKNGCVHIIRSSPGYDDALVGLSKHDKDYLRDGERGYTLTSPGRAKRVADATKRVRSPPTRLAASVQEQRFKPKPKSRLY